MVQDSQPPFVPISIHPPRVGWDGVQDSQPPFVPISIHPPRVGWDPAPCSRPAGCRISIHPPRVGWDFQALPAVAVPFPFQSTHPVWGGTLQGAPLSYAQAISIHPPRVGWDMQGYFFRGAVTISIHPPRVGWDAYEKLINTPVSEFQSTHPVWGGTGTIPPPAMPARFQSTHPVWGGTCQACPWKYRARGFQSTHPVWGGTVSSEASTVLRTISIHPPRVGWDLIRHHQVRHVKDFNPPTPCGVGRYSSSVIST